MTFPLPTITFKASNKKTGMTFPELQEAMAMASSKRVTRIAKVRVGFRGQIQSVEFGAP